MAKNAMTLVASLLLLTVVGGPASTQTGTGLPPQGVYTIRHMATKRCFDAHGRTEKDFALVTRRDQHSDTQRWILTPHGNNEYRIQQKSNLRFVDAHEHAGRDFAVVTRPFQPNDSQVWILRPVVAPPADAYVIQQKSSRRVIDAHDTSDKDFGIVTRPSRLDSTQAWIIKPAQ